MYRRKGISTILGTLIFIGILFSAIVPMVLVMNQVNLIYSKQLHETENKDTDKAHELINVSAYPDDVVIDEITIQVNNDGETPVEIVRVWINNVPTSVSIIVNPKTTETLGNFDVDLQDESYFIKVTTSNGNIFRDNDGTLYYDNAEGIWLIPEMGVSVYITNNGNSKFSITINDHTDTVEVDGFESGSTREDVSKLFILEKDLTYIVHIEKWAHSDWEALLGTPVTVTLTWPGDTLIQIFVSGDYT